MDVTVMDEETATEAACIEGNGDEWFLEALSKEPMPVADMTAVLNTLNPESALDRAAMMLDELCSRKEFGAVAEVLNAACVISAETDRLRELLGLAADKISEDRRGRMLVRESGLKSNDIPPREAARRFSVVASLEPGGMCFAPTWGFGLIKGFDDLYKKVEIDFSEKPGHELSYSYAAEKLELIDENHIFAIKHRDPEGLAEMVKTDPGEVVRITIRSFGPLKPALIKEKLADRIIPETEWKSFWAAARKALGSDPRVRLPAKASGEVVLLESEAESEKAWVCDLEGERDPARILEIAREALRNMTKGESSRRITESVRDRLVYGIKTAEIMGDFALEARILLYLRQIFGEAADKLDGMEERIERLFDKSALLAAAEGLPARDVALLMRLLAKRDQERLAGFLLEAVAGMPEVMLTETSRFLAESGRSADFAARLKEVLDADGADVPLVYWLCSNLDSALDMNIAGLDRLLMLYLDCVESRAEGDTNRTVARLRSLIEDKEWFAGVLKRLDGPKRELLLTRAWNSRAWDEGARRSIAATAIKLYPELNCVVSVGERKPSFENSEVKVTSWRSYLQRQEQLRKLVEETIPQNSQEIGVARSYGDLRENFEYQAAKDRQRLLMSRRDELENDLAAVRGTDFADCETGVAGMGTTVSMRREDGTDIEYTILGLWDSDEDLGIVSSSSAVARALKGRREGDEILLPDGAEGGNGKYRVVAVGPVREPVKEWLAERGNSGRSELSGEGVDTV